MEGGQLMAGVSYFQRYSQKENHVTNNTLLVMRHLYEAGPAKLQQVLRELLGDEQLSLGPAFTQQIKGSRSVPDALIEQQAFRIFFETKLTQALDLDQLRRHIESIRASAPEGAEAVLIGLSTAPMLKKDEDAVASWGKDHCVVFKSVSFAALVEAVQGACADHETTLRAVIDDFVDFLANESLLYASDDWMLVMPCGVSYAENERFGVYYDGAHRPSRSPCKYLGAYKDKCVSLVGEIKAVIIARYSDGAVIKVADERGTATPEMLDRVRQIIEATPYYDLRTKDHRYFILDQFQPTELVKITKGPVRGAQYLQLSPLLGDGVKAKNAAELAKKLRGKTFPANAAIG
jgi:hypothetical protein